MKNTTLLLALVIGICSSCKEENKEIPVIDYLLFSGTLTNPNSNELKISDVFYNDVRSVTVQENGVFSDTLKLAAGYYFLNDGKERTPVYFVPVADLSLTVNTEAFDESIKYEGEGAAENNYLAQKALIIESFGTKNYYGYYAKLDENDFLHLADSLHGVTLNFLKEQNGVLSTDFAEMEEEALRYDRVRKLNNYESMRRFVAKEPDFKVSDSYPKLFTDIDFSDDTKLGIPGYTSVADAYLGGMARNRDDDTADYYLSYIRIMDHTIESAKLKERLAYSLGKGGLESTDHRKAFYQSLKKNIEDPMMMAEIDEKRSALNKISPGIPSPDFEFSDKNGERVALKDLRGQLVYIDIWATWCLPCINEIPHLQELEETMADEKIQFVSICKNDEKSKWENMVAEKELGGIQLFAAENEDEGFFETYMVNGIPRFILLDTEGNIVDANAKRPSNPELSEQIHALLSE